MVKPPVLKSQVEIGESSKAKPRVTTRILLNKWQRQLEKERYQKRKYEEERRRAEEEARKRDLEQYTREQERAHWGCAFFRHCWNEGLKLPTLRNCRECSDRYFEYRQETANRRSVHERIGRIHPSEDRRQKIEIIDHPRKRQADLRWADQEEDEDEYIWQKRQWCPPGLRKSQKRRVQRLRNRELRQAGIQKGRCGVQRINLKDQNVRLQRAWYIFCRMNLWLPLIRLCTKRRPWMMNRLRD
jgi:hypothetical protein